jgi:uracil phosphoribosyltransferase
MGYEALRDLRTEERPVETPIEQTMSTEIAERKQAVVPILRAGLGMTDGILSLIPTAKVGHVGMYRDPNTHEPHEYYCKLPNDLENLEIYVIDPMLATGGSAIDAIRLLKEHGAKNLHFICIIAAPEGIKAFCEANPDIPLTVGALDRQLNENAYICPGLGDAGDRIFGTVK